ncbi:hypothetical protein BU24DRAFT_180575 [Aaosphaeria arxii CBS 175.79]|uniref:Zn(2)-C6 fungal-type domain-containing protein n=1 Tax=Aaosphaeria arxii CBS 175.79 TaxID=1450172 RepID=A0A6A5XTI9_9PLEO|nr:uncharacterized protein BU24DRAFT_180575 [Aaosphaeria arxii CBS 175.79]KAF2015564.1 hypothetical protein BU24DRAFT_180575 [Aaosphaeria arxii CBS 175.79]
MRRPVAYKAARASQYSTVLWFISLLPNSSVHLKMSVPPQPSSRQTPPTGSTRKRPPLSREKCNRCRRDKVKCMPIERRWPQKCNRCIEKEFECSENTHADGKRKKRGRLESPSPPKSSGGSNSELEPPRGRYQDQVQDL